MRTKRLIYKTPMPEKRVALCQAKDLWLSAAQMDAKRCRTRRNGEWCRGLRPVLDHNYWCNNKIPDEFFERIGRKLGEEVWLCVVKAAK